LAIENLFAKQAGKNQFHFEITEIIDFIKTMKTELQAVCQVHPPSVVNNFIVMQCNVMLWIRGQQDTLSLHINMLTVSSDFSIQGNTASRYQSIYKLTVTHP